MPDRTVVRVIGLLVGLSLPGVGLGQGECFRTVREAASQAGVRDGEGFRLEGVTADRMGSGSWARVVRCGHPEQPGAMVKVKGAATVLQAGRAAQQEVRMLLVKTGTVVRVVGLDAMSRLEMAGVAQGDGAVGERVKVRVPSDGEARFVEGLVKGEGLVEMEMGR